MHQGVADTSAPPSSEVYSWANASMHLSQKEYEVQNETIDINLRSYINVSIRDIPLVTANTKIAGYSPTIFQIFSINARARYR